MLQMIRFLLAMPADRTVSMCVCVCVCVCVCMCLGTGRYIHIYMCVPSAGFVRRKLLPWQAGTVPKP